mmetsp:Transcript_22393/g.57111  ORF Transcript_22393/g.57111 Transcript_22393/m.57111 type:complete len:110 (-) Transcript_22393:151-480(-)
MRALFDARRALLDHTLLETVQADVRLGRSGVRRGFLQVHGAHHLEIVLARPGQVVRLALTLEAPEVADAGTGFEKLAAARLRSLFLNSRRPVLVPWLQWVLETAERAGA